MVAAIRREPVVIERTEQAFLGFVQQYAGTFFAINVAFPEHAAAITDLAKAAFLAGANYEYEHLAGRVPGERGE